MGRPPALDAARQSQVKRRLAEGEPIAALAREFGVGRATVQRLRDEGAQFQQIFGRFVGQCMFNRSLQRLLGESECFTCAQLVQRKGKVV